MRAPAPRGTTTTTSSSSSSSSLIHASETALIATFAPTATRRAIRLPTGDVINTLTYGSATAPAVLFLHGWGAGCAFFAPIIPHFLPHYRLYLIDWPGFGGSSRPPHDLHLPPEAAVRFFTAPLHAWMRRIAELDGVHRFFVVAHSLGAYLAACYALRYPRAVRALVLASPVGIPPSPARLVPEGGVLRRVLVLLAFWFWQRGFTPQYFMRLLPVWLGYLLSALIINPRFLTADEEVRRAYVRYFYAISCGAPSAEHSLCTILKVGAFAKRPLLRSLARLQVRTLFMYGDRDWMHRAGLKEVVRDMPNADIAIVEKAGHHLYFDNVEQFVALVKGVLSEMEEDEQEEQGQ